MRTGIQKLLAITLTGLFLSSPQAALALDFPNEETSDESVVSVESLIPETPETLGTVTDNLLGEDNQGTATLPEEASPIPFDNAVKDSQIQSGLTIENPEKALTENCLQNRSLCAELKIKLLDFVASGYSQVGDTVEGIIDEDVTIADRIWIPKGSKLVGVVTYSENDSKAHHNRPHLEIEFQQVYFPQNKEHITISLPWETQDSWFSQVGRDVKQGAKKGFWGFLKGSKRAFDYGGLQTAVMTYGGSLLGGGIWGAVIETTNGVKTSHQVILIEENSTIKIWLDKEILTQMIDPEWLKPDSMQLALSPLIAKQSLYDLIIQRVKLEKDPFDTKNQLVIDFELKNQSLKDITAYQLAVEDDSADVISCPLLMQA